MTAGVEGAARVTPVGGSAKRLCGVRVTRLTGIVWVVVALAAGSAVWGFLGRFHHGGIRNVVLVSIDTCRADRLSCYGYRRPTTPNIDEVARDGVQFNDASTPVPITLPAHSSMLTGTYPPTHGVRLNEVSPLDGSNVTLAEILRAAGYQAAAFVGGFTMDSRFGLDQGFDTYDCRFTGKEGKAFYSERKADEVSRSALAWLETHAGKPFFLFLHYFDPHAPYTPPPAYAASSSADDLYAGEIAYVDHCIGQVLDRLRSLGAYDNTLLIITGDHGESLGEHGEPSHTFFIYQSVLHVPLIIRAPMAGRGLRVDGAVSLVDIVPTVVDLIGLKTPPGVQGLSLRRSLKGSSRPGRVGSDLVRPGPIYSESLYPSTFGCGPLQGIVDGKWKFIRAPKPELYDLSRDPGELSNIIGQEPQVAQQLRSRLDAMLREMGSAASGRARSMADLEAAKRLQSLGYVSGGLTPDAAFDPAREDPKDFLPTYNRIHNAYDLFEKNRNREAEKESLEILAERPDLIMAERLLGNIALSEKRTLDARRHFDRMADILAKPGGATRLITAAEADYIRLGCHMDLGEALMSEGKVDEAALEFESALRLDPRLSHAHFSLGLARQQTNRLPEAIEHYEQALQIQPDDPKTHNNLGNALRQVGRIPESIGHFEQALRIKPDFVEAHYNAALTLEQAGRLPEAVGHYADAVRLNGDLPVALNKLAWIRATSNDPRLRDGTEAVRLAERACQLTGRKQVALLDTLAAAYAEAGRFAEAVSTAREALSLATSGGQPEAAATIESRLSLYRAGQPCRQAPQDTRLANP